MYVKPNPKATVLLGHEGEGKDAVPVTMPVAVHDPHTGRLIPADGAEVPETAYYLRRLRDGDLVKATAPATAPAGAPEPAAEEAHQ